MNPLPKRLGAPVAAPPEGVEIIPTLDDLTRRIGHSERECSRLLRVGTLRPLNDGVGAQSYRSADLDGVMDPAKLAVKFDAQVDAVTARIDQVLDRLDSLTRRPAGGRLQLSAVDTTAGILRGVVVLQAGVELTGKTIMADAAGIPTKDPAAARQKLPVFSDAKTLTSLLGACQDAGNKLRVRVDHDDSVQARAGFATDFRLDGDVVRCDVTLFAAFKGRDLVMETADRSPELMGLSVDIVPGYEIRDGKAFLRVLELIACDIVDEGAGTPGGFFSE